MWNGESLIEYFKEGVIINALPDAPEQQLPTARLKRILSLQLKMKSSHSETDFEKEGSSK